jgi:predicted dehydrogenase
VKAAETYGVQIMPAYNLRYTPAFQKMKEIVDSGKLGKLPHQTASMPPDHL